MIRNDPQLHTIWRILKDFFAFQGLDGCLQVFCTIRVYGGVLGRSSEGSARFKWPDLCIAGYCNELRVKYQAQLSVQSSAIKMA